MREMSSAIDPEAIDLASDVLSAITEELIAEHSLYHDRLDCAEARLIFGRLGDVLNANQILVDRLDALADQEGRAI